MTDDELATLERDAAEALLEWLGDRRLRTEEGMVIVWSDGRPVAADVLHAIRVLRQAQPA